MGQYGICAAGGRLQAAFLIFHSAGNKRASGAAMTSHLRHTRVLALKCKIVLLKMSALKTAVLRVIRHAAFFCRIHAAFFCAAACYIRFFAAAGVRS